MGTECGIDAGGACEIAINARQVFLIMRQSARSFVETIEFGTQNPESANVENLVRQSRKELVMPYAQVGSPERALGFDQIKAYVDSATPAPTAATAPTAK